MAFREAVFAEALDLAEAAFGKVPLIATFDHALDHFGVEGVDGAGLAEGRHGAAQLVGFPGVNPAATMAICMACSWNNGTPSVLPSTSSSS